MYPTPRPSQATQNSGSFRASPMAISSSRASFKIFLLIYSFQSVLRITPQPQHQYLFQSNHEFIHTWQRIPHFRTCHSCHANLGPYVLWYTYTSASHPCAAWCCTVRHRLTRITCASFSFVVYSEVRSSVSSLTSKQFRLTHCKERSDQRR